MKISTPTPLRLASGLGAFAFGVAALTGCVQQAPATTTETVVETTTVEAEPAQDGGDQGGTDTAAAAEWKPFVDPDGDPVEACSALTGIDPEKDADKWRLGWTEEDVNKSYVATDEPFTGEFATLFGDGEGAIECGFVENDGQAKESAYASGYMLLQDGEAQKLRDSLAAIEGMEVREEDGRTIYTYTISRVYHRGQTYFSVGENDVFWAEGKPAWDGAPDL